MKFYCTLVLIVLLGVAAVFGWFMLNVAESFHKAAYSLERASNDYRDSAQNYEAERLRIAQELSQLAKDRIRIRAHLQKKGG